MPPPMDSASKESEPQMRIKGSELLAMAQPHLEEKRKVTKVTSDIEVPVQRSIEMPINMD